MALCAAVVLILAPKGSAKTYHVSLTGSDSFDGAAAGTVFATIQKAATVMQAGDTCLIHAGTYRETVTPPRSGLVGSPILFQSAGDGKVVISGAEKVNGPWSVHSGSIYKTSVTLSSTYNDRMTSNTTLLANQIFVAGEMMAQARWPNLRDTNAANPSVDTTRASPPAIQGSYQGGVCWESSWFSCRTGIIQNADATQIQFAQALCATRNELRRWYCGVLGLLDAEREWHYDPSTTTLYLWAPGGASPGQVEAKVRNFAFDLSGKSYITIRRISLFAATAITNSSSRHVIIDGISARYVSHHATLPTIAPPHSDGCNQIASHTDDTGIMLYGDTSIIMNSTIGGSSGNGVLVAGKGCVVYNCLIYDCDYMGSYAAAVQALQYPVFVLHNTIYGAGRDGVTWDWHRAAGGMNGSLYNSEFAYNHIYDYGRLQADLAGIYICCGIHMTGTEFHHNKIHGCLAPYWCEQIYFDNGSTDACTYENEATVRYNLGGSAGSCPSDTIGKKLVPAGCNFAGCGESQGARLPSYSFVPIDSASLAARTPLGRRQKDLMCLASAWAGALIVRSAGLTRLDLHDASGRMVRSWRTPPAVLRIAGLGRGIYVVRAGEPCGACRSHTSLRRN
jgi:hypothetical protein